MKIVIINGPNLNLLGLREPGLYGPESMEHYLPRLRQSYPDVAIEYYQSNHEGDIIDKLHAVGRGDYAADGIVLNAGAYTHTSLAIADAIAAIEVPVVEVHLTNVAAREAIRRTSLTAPVCRGVISGFGLDVYRLAIESFES